ncbi:hypothetical protein PQX77_019544 [Marasmius sp. AFHP31]|nr:hypothetical protein PQX77_019544 [Marasmius sp. AFHP31]
MKKLIKQGECPHNAVALAEIPIDQLFTLDVDDVIWEDGGLTNEWDNRTPPLWLGDETVRSGIRAVLELDRSQEELKRLSHEQDAMQTWFAEEWEVVEDAIERNIHPDVDYQLKQRRDELLQLCGRWTHSVGDWTVSSSVPQWGPSNEDIRSVRLKMWSERLADEASGLETTSPYLNDELNEGGSGIRRDGLQHVTNV